MNIHEYIENFVRNLRAITDDKPDIIHPPAHAPRMHPADLLIICAVTIRNGTDIYTTEFMSIDDSILEAKRFIAAATEAAGKDTP